MSETQRLERQHFMEAYTKEVERLILEGHNKIRDDAIIIDKTKKEDWTGD